MNIRIDTAQVIELASQIEDLTDKIQTAMSTLDTAIKNTIPEGIETAWSEEVLEKWNSYYKSDVPATIAEIKLSAANLRVSAAGAEAIDKANM